MILTVVDMFSRTREDIVLLTHSDRDNHTRLKTASDRRVLMKNKYYDPMFYICSEQMPFTCRLSYTMTDPVSEASLRFAADMAMRRFPHFGMRVVREGEEYVTVPNPLPLVVYRDDAVIHPLGSDAVNGHVLAIGYHDCTVDFLFSHCITDGGGFVMFIKTFMYYYLCDRTGTTLDHAGIELVDSPIYPDEVGNPFPEEQMNSAVPLYIKKCGPYFRLRDGGYVTDHKQTIYRFCVPEKAMMAFSFDHDGSPNALLSVLMTRAIQEVHPEEHRSIVCAISFNYRSCIGNRHNYRLLSSTLLMEYPESTRQDDIMKLCTCTRGMITLQSQPENALYLAKQRKALVESLEDIPTLEERCRVMGARALEDANSNTFSISYVGKTERDSIAPYIRSIYNITDGSTYENAFMEVTAVDGNFCIALLQGFSSDVYYRALLRQFDACGIPYTEDTVIQPFGCPGIILP